MLVLGLGLGLGVGYINGLLGAGDRGAVVLLGQEEQGGLLPGWSKAVTSATLARDRSSPGPRPCVPGGLGSKLWPGKAAL